jgi:hypothetical protein
MTNTDNDGESSSAPASTSTVEGTGTAKITSGNASFDKELQSGFAKLIAEAKARQKKAMAASKSEEATATTEDKDADEAMEQSPCDDDYVVVAPGTLAHAPSTTSTGESEPSDASKIANSIDTNGAMSPPPSAKTTSTASIASDSSQNSSRTNTLKEVAVTPVSSQSDASRKSQHQRTAPPLPLASNDCLDTPSRKRSSEATISSTEKRSRRTGTPVSDGIHHKLTPASPPSITGPWVCSCCTFLNAVRVWTGAKCQMCETGKRTLSASATGIQHSLQSPNHNSSESPEIVEVDC